MASTRGKEDNVVEQTCGVEFNMSQLHLNDLDTLKETIVEVDSDDDKYETPEAQDSITSTCM